MVERTTRRPPVVPDRVLVAASRDGDLQAFGELVERHQAAMYRLAFRLLRSSADAEDAAQEAFVRAWRSIGRFQGDAAFSTWMYRITTNACLDAMARRSRTEPVDDLAASTAEADGDASDVAEGRERFRAVTGAIGRLAPDLRVALVLRDLQGLRYEEIAEVLDVPLSTVKGRIHRARLTVVQELGEAA